MASILIVEDEPAIANLIKLSLVGAGHSCEIAPDGAIAADMLERRAFDLALLDVMVPEIDGFELLPFCKMHGVPAIFITAVDALEKRVSGLRMGAEDYIVKPFEIDELLARVEVVLRRSGHDCGSLMVGDIEIDPEAMRVTRNGEEVQLTRKEYELLIVFVRNPGKALYRETLYERVWGGEMAYGSKTVDLHVQRLRRKTGLDCIRAVSKVGYRLDVPIGEGSA